MRETPTKTSIVAVVLITAGVTICSVFGPHDNGELDPADLCQLFDTNPTLFALCISGGFLFLIFSLTTTFYADSVRAVRRIVVVDADGTVVEDHSEQACQPGRGHQDFSTEPCL